MLECMDGFRICGSDAEVAGFGVGRRIYASGVKCHVGTCGMRDTDWAGRRRLFLKKETGSDGI